MMTKCRCTTMALAFVLGLFAGTARAADPVVDFVNVSQRPGTKLVDIEYSLSHPDPQAALTVSVSGKNNDTGATVPMTTLSGAGAGGQTVSPGTRWSAMATRSCLAREPSTGRCNRAARTPHH